MVLQTILVLAAAVAAGGIAWELGSRYGDYRRHFRG